MNSQFIVKLTYTVVYIYILKMYLLWVYFHVVQIPNWFNKCSEKYNYILAITWSGTWTYAFLSIDLNSCFIVMFQQMLTMSFKEKSILTVLNPAVECCEKAFLSQQLQLVISSLIFKSSIAKVAKFQSLKSAGKYALWHRVRVSVSKYTNEDYDKGHFGC